MTILSKCRCCWLNLLLVLLGIHLARGTVWNGVQGIGQHLMREVEADLQALEAGDGRGQESVAKELKGRPLVIGADGVLVPFRPQAGTLEGKTRWGEMKV